MSSVTPAKGKIDAVETLVKRACDKTMYNFVSLSGMHPYSWGYGYSCKISYLDTEFERTYDIYLKFTALADGVEITFFLSNGEYTYALVPFERDDDEQIKALRDFFGGGFTFRKGCAYALAKAPAELSKPP